MKTAENNKLNYRKSRGKNTGCRRECLEFETVTRPEVGESERTGKEKTLGAARGGINSTSRASSRNRRACEATDRANGELEK